LALRKQPNPGLPTAECGFQPHFERVTVKVRREGSFEPLLLPKHARRFTAFDDSIVALYARGALRVKIHEDNVVRNKAVYLALGVRRDGTREILGLWIETTERAKFWMKVFNDLRSRGVLDILIAVTDGLTGMPAALEAVFPQTTLQTCIVHLTATASTMPVGRTASHWRRRWMRSRVANGDGSSPPWCRPSAAPGRR
jgi:transposase-like protein